MLRKLFAFIFFLFSLCLLSFAQNFTVRDIMREPSLTGMRPDSERISPDGQKVIFSWNSEGKEPRNLYIWTGGEPKILVNAEQNFEQRSAPPESKLNYGLTVRDDFVKAREKNLFGVEFSPDSNKLLFMQNGDIYILSMDGKLFEIEKEISKAEEILRELRVKWNDEYKLVKVALESLTKLNDEKQKIISQNGQFIDLKPRRVTRTQGFESSARWLTNDSILFSSNGNFFVLNIKETSLIQVTREANPAAFLSIFNPAPTKDGKFLGYVVSDGSRQRALFVPNYLDEFTTAPTFRRGWTEQRVLVAPTDGSAERPFDIKLPKAEGVSYIRGLKWAADNQSLIVDRIDKDTKRRQLFYVHNVGSKAEKIILVTEETDEKWVAPLSRLVEPHPKDSSQILFASERDGYNHLYLAALERDKTQPNPTGEIRQENPSDAGFTGKVETKQLTKGNFEINFAAWRENRDEIVFASTEKNTAEREFFIVNSKTGQKSDVPSGEKGMKIDAQMANSGDSIYLLFKNSRWNAPTELFVQRICPECAGINTEKKITNSTPESFKKISWAEPKFVDIPTRDGKVVKSKVYFPNNFDKTKKYPMVIFVHGAGYLQNTINGWNNYYREFMFNDLLTRKGYVVLDIDFRGSAGYGRDWRTDVHDFLGGKDYEDHLDAIDYSVKNYAVDPKRVGVYGGSYGGFMAGMLIMRAPDKVAAAAALRPVFDWKNYYASSNVYTTERLGFPDKNPEAYKRSSPIAYADKLEKPLLILHGLLDDNVHAQDSIQLIEKLMRLEKTQYFEAMFYPAENHGFTRPSSWADEYERILSFFEKHLK